MIDNALEEAKSNPVKKERFEKSLFGKNLTNIFNNDKVTAADELSLFFFAASDTTSNTAHWLIYHLANNQGVQEKLYQELKTVLKGDVIRDPETAKELNYLKAIIKENHRLTPASEGSQKRVTTDNCTIGGYHIPQNTTVFFVWQAPSQELIQKYMMILMCLDLKDG